MAITKTLEEDKIEIVGEFKQINVRTATIIKEDGTELNRSFHRKVIHSGYVDMDVSGNWVDTDISSESTEVKAIASAVWTTSIKNAYKAFLIATRPS